MFEESIYNLIPREYVPPPKQSRYRSKYPPNTAPTASTFGLKTTSKAICSNLAGEYDLFEGPHRFTSNSATFGKLKGASKPDPKTFRHRSTGAVKLPEVKKFSYSTQQRKDPVPKRNEQPIHGLKSEKNYIVANAVDVILKAPKVQEEPMKYKNKKCYGKTPPYLRKIQGEIEEEYQTLRQLHLEQEEEKNKQQFLLSQQEVEELRQGLQQKLQAINKQYQTITHISKVDTIGLKRKKENCEKEMKQIEQDLETLAKNYVFVDATSQQINHIHQNMRYQRVAQSIFNNVLKEIEQAGTYKRERIIQSPQDMQIISQGQQVLNFCANNYLGLSNNQYLIDASKRMLDSYGFGLSSVRFICGTQDIHKQLESKISYFHGVEDSILYSSCFDANAGIFEGILTSEDCILTDGLNHASIIDGVRLSKAHREIYKHLDMNDLEEKLKKNQDKRIRLIVTDGVFSMDGDFAPLPDIVKLADTYNALLMVDESHATGFIGRTGRGTPEYFDVASHIDIINSTMGKALGGATGGYTAGRQEIVDLLRQRSRPYLFSNSLAPPIIGAAIEVFDLLSNSSELPEKLNRNTRQFREGMKSAGFNIIGHQDSPIVPVMLGDAKLASEFADEMLQKGIYVIGFSFPVVPKGQARIRVQLSAAHTQQQIERAISAFAEVGRSKGVISQQQKNVYML